MSVEAYLSEMFSGVDRIPDCRILEGRGFIAISGVEKFYEFIRQT
jgi:hypothetical protein